MDTLSEKKVRKKEGNSARDDLDMSRKGKSKERNWISLDKQPKIDTT